MNTGSIEILEDPTIFERKYLDADENVNQKSSFFRTVV